MCVAGLAREDYRLEPARYDEVRAGCYEIERAHPGHGHRRHLGLGELPVRASPASAARSSPTPRTASWASPACAPGTTGSSRSGTRAHPDRIVPLGVTFLADPEKGAEEIRRNAARGFRAVTLPEQPHRLGLPTRLRCALGADHAGLRGDRDRAQPARRLVRLSRDAARRSGARARRHPVRSHGAPVLRGVAVERLARPLSRPQDRDVRGRHRLGGHARSIASTTS